MFLEQRGGRRAANGRGVGCAIGLGEAMTGGSFPAQVDETDRRTEKVKLRDGNMRCSKYFFSRRISRSKVRLNAAG
jgi:hypothetical protein